MLRDRRRLEAVVAEAWFQGDGINILEAAKIAATFRDQPLLLKSWSADDRSRDSVAGAHHFLRHYAPWYSSKFSESRGSLLYIEGRGRGLFWIQNLQSVASFGLRYSYYTKEIETYFHADEKYDILLPEPGFKVPKVKTKRPLKPKRIVYC